MKKISALLLLTALVFQGKTQSNMDWKAYGRSMVDTLSSGMCFGRGYVREGEKKAAYLVATEFTKMGLKHFAPTPYFYHNFEYPVNAFPEITFLALDEKFLACGADYIPSPDCPTIIGEFPIVQVDSSVLTNPEKLKELISMDLTQSAVLLDDSGVSGEKNLEIVNAIRYGGLEVRCIIDLQNKLTFSVATEQAKIPRIEILRTSYTKSAKTFRVKITSMFTQSYPTQNVLGYVEGSEVIDTFIVFSAHYDHLGMIGNVMFPGANDNASGVAMMLALAKYYSLPENRPKYTHVFIAFGGEEAGLLGSEELTNGKVITLNRIKFMVNMDIMGTGDEGITVVNATEHPEQFSILQKINTENNYLTQIKSRGKAKNSDHYYFSEKGVPAFFIYTMGGISAYHDIYDKPETLPLTEFDDLFALLRKFSTEIQK